MALDTQATQVLLAVRRLPRAPRAPPGVPEQTASDPRVQLDLPAISRWELLGLLECLAWAAPVVLPVRRGELGLPEVREQQEPWDLQGQQELRKLGPLVRLAWRASMALAILAILGPLALQVRVTPTSFPRKETSGCTSER